MISFILRYCYMIFVDLRHEALRLPIIHTRDWALLPMRYRGIIDDCRQPSFLSGLFLTSIERSRHWLLKLIREAYTLSIYYKVRLYLFNCDARARSLLYRASIRVTVESPPLSPVIPAAAATGRVSGLLLPNVPLISQWPQQIFDALIHGQLRISFFNGRVIIAGFTHHSSGVPPLMSFYHYFRFSFKPKWQ